MAIDLDIPKPEKLVKRTFELPQSVAAEFDQYVEAAKEGSNEVNEHLVLRALIERQLKKDRKFRQWLADRSSAPNAAAKHKDPPTSAPASEALAS